GWSGNADHNAARNVLHLYRMGLALVPAAGRAVVRRAKRVKPAAARQAGISRLSAGRALQLERPAPALTRLDAAVSRLTAAGHTEETEPLTALAARLRDEE
ncbi:hypothetical protein ACFWOL_34860, partial [Streptomyces sp. NPDC058442]